MNEVEYIDTELEGDETRIINSSGKEVPYNQSFSYLLDNANVILPTFGILFTLLLFLIFRKSHKSDSNNEINKDEKHNIKSSKQGYMKEIDYPYTYNDKDK